MRQVLEIKAAYDWMIATHQRAYREALIAGDKPGQDRLDRDRDHLEKGMFVLLFAQFEVAMNGSFDRARALRQSSADWPVRRGWDTPGLRRKLPSFETRLAMTLDRNSPEYGEVVAAY